jgi:membrane associated rhomboid family serine protease
MSGFENTPITKVISFAALSLGLFLGQSHSITFDYTEIFSGHVSRLITSQLAFENMAQTIVGLMLLYSFRTIERQMGVKKFGAYVLFSYTISILLQLAVAVLVVSNFDVNFVPIPGPYFLIFSLLAIYYGTYRTCHQISDHLEYAFLFYLMRIIALWSQQ